MEHWSLLRVSTTRLRRLPMIPNTQVAGATTLLTTLFANRCDFNAEDMLADLNKPSEYISKCHSDLRGLRRGPCDVWAGHGASLGCRLSTAVKCGTRAAVVTVLCYSERYCCTVKRQSVFLDVRPMV